MRRKGMSGAILQFKITLVCLLAVLLCCAGAWAQVTTGLIAATVKDTSGAVVPNATVTLTNTDTNVVVRTVKTGQRVRVLLQSDVAAGRFLWKALSPTFLYAARRLPEIADRIVEIDRAMNQSPLFVTNCGALEYP